MLKAAALANMDLGVLPEEVGQAIVKACDSLINLELLKQFQVDAIQGGAGTSTNMNANEVIANRALEILGHEKGRYDNAPPGYAPVAVDHLKKLTGLPMQTSADLVEATWDTGAYVQLSGVLRRIAVKLSKICNDLRLLSSGPRAGLNEINLPKMQPGSSIMPGKVNPVIPEVVNQIAFQVIGMDVTVTLAAEAGQLQLNVMEPVMAFDLFVMLEMLKRGCRVLEVKYVQGITANADRCRELVLNSIGIVTALNPIIGYESSAAIAKEALETGRSVHDLALEKGVIDKEKLEKILSVENLMNPKFFRK